jgi:signal peptidase
MFLGLAAATLLVVLAVLARSDADGISRVAGHPVLTVLSDSMTPTFRAGDLLVDRPASGPATGVHVGDAITFKTGTAGHLITHRIIAVETSPTGAISFRTQGDANNAADAEPVAPDQVVGVYSARIPYAGYALQAAHSRTGLFLLIVVPVLALLLPAFRKWWHATAEPATDAEHRPLAAAATVPTGERPEGRAAPAES